MRKSKFTEEQIAFALKRAESGTSVEEVCRKMGVSQATFYLWRKKFGGLGVSELRRLRQLEEENRKLKQLVADLSLDKAMCRMCWQKSSEARAAQVAGGPSAGPVSSGDPTRLPLGRLGEKLLVPPKQSTG
jgi:putative transposase